MTRYLKDNVSGEGWEEGECLAAFIDRKGEPKPYKPSLVRTQVTRHDRVRVARLLRPEVQAGTVRTLVGSSNRPIRTYKSSDTAINLIIRRVIHDVLAEQVSDRGERDMAYTSYSFMNAEIGIIGSILVFVFFF